MEELLTAFREYVFRVVDEKAFAASACLMHAQGMKRYEHRSGIFVQIADKHFLVTAAHHLIDWYNQGVDTFIVRDEKGSPPVEVITDRWYTTIDEKADLAVCLLDPVLVEYLGPGQQYLRITDFAPKRECGEGWYVIVGFPIARLGHDEDGLMASEGWKYLTLRYAKLDLVENYDKETHLILMYDRSTTDGEKIVHPPAMSGCGIWFVQKNIPSIVTPDDLKICAIQTAWHKGHEYAKGTWTDVVLNIIWTYFPELQPVMRMHGCDF